MVHPTIEATFRCPRCRGTLARAVGDDASLLGYDCVACAVRYPSRDGVVDFTPSEAVPLADGAERP